MYITFLPFPVPFQNPSPGADFRGNDLLQQAACPDLSLCPLIQRLAGFQIIPEKIPDNRQGVFRKTCHGCASLFPAESILRRSGGADPVPFRHFLQHIQTEKYIFFQYGKDSFQILPVAGKKVFLKQISAHPGSAERPVSPDGHARSGRCLSPDIHIMETGRSFPAQQLAGTFSAVFQQLPVHPLQRLRQFMQTAGPCQPVVHLRIDIYGIIAKPGGYFLLIPDSLKIGRLRPRPGRGNQEISAEVKQHGIQRDILFPCLKPRKPLPQIHFFPAAFSQIQAHPSKVGSIVTDMLLPQLFKRPAAALHVLPGQDLRIRPFRKRMPVKPVEARTNAEI